MAGLLAIGVVVLAGCDEPRMVSWDGGVLDASVPAESGRIVIETATALALAPTEDATFVARWLDERGQPVAMRDVAFALEGTPRGATLFSLGGRTDAEGRVEGMVIAGRETATFRVRVSAPSATPAYVDVAVSSSGFGRLVVQVEGGEGRDIAQRTVLLHQATASPVPCSDALTRPDADRSRTTDEAGVVELATLPAGERFTIVARATGTAGVIVAEGCVEHVVIEPERETRAAITLVRRTLGIEGEYDTALTVAAGASPRTAADALLTALDASTLAQGGDAVMMLDALETDLDARGEADLVTWLRDARAAGAEAELAGRLELEGAPSVALRELIEELVVLHRSLRVGGRLFVAGSSAGPVASFTRGELQLGAEDEPLIIDLRAHGVSARAPTAVRWNDVTDELAVDALRIELPIGSSMMAALAALAVQRGAEDLVQLAAPRAGCGALAGWVAESPELDAACDAECAAAACRVAVQAGLEVVTTTASALDQLRARVVLSGALASEDGDGNLTVDAIRADALTGEWRSADGGAAEPVQATLGGERVSPLP